MKLTMKQAYKLLKFLRGFYFEIRVGLPLNWCMWIIKRLR
jgi:hypothetical protein